MPHPLFKGIYTHSYKIIYLATVLHFTPFVSKVSEVNLLLWSLAAELTSLAHTLFNVNANSWYLLIHPHVDGFAWGQIHAWRAVHRSLHSSISVQDTGILVQPHPFVFSGHFPPKQIWLNAPCINQICQIDILGCHCTLLMEAQCLLAQTSLRPWDLFSKPCSTNLKYYCVIL